MKSATRRSSCATLRNSLFFFIFTRRQANDSHMGQTLEVLVLSELGMVGRNLQNRRRPALRCRIISSESVIEGGAVQRTKAFEAWNYLSSWKSSLKPRSEN